jgi:ectoine hydroxylase-related dioxygenase (phytanoyl-CoA dioxygenase family)
MTLQDIKQIKDLGYVVLKNAVNISWIDLLRSSIDQSFKDHEKTRKQTQNEINNDGVALHVLLSNSIYLEFLNYLLSTDIIKTLKSEYFGSNCILNSFSALNNIPNRPNFSSIVHRDLRFYSHNLPVMVNCLLMIDEFTIENGGTYLLPYSHHKEEKPSDEYFFKNAIQITGNEGDLLIFDSNVWHASAPNKTDKDRRAIPITISRSFMKQLLDYPRALGFERMNEFSEDLQQFLGYHSRVPSSLNEWYLPENNRFYKKNQD